MFHVKHAGAPILAATAALLALTPSVAHAEPQATIGFTLGGALTDLRGDGPDGAFHFGGHADVLFLRTSGRSMGLGPYIDAATTDFDTLDLGGGLSWLLPAFEDLPFVLSAGAHARRAPLEGWQPGVSSTLFFGSRSYNYHSWYGLTAGLFVQARYGLLDSTQGEVIFGAQIDASLLAYPFLFLCGALTP